MRRRNERGLFSPRYFCISPSTAIRRAVQSAVMLDEGDAGNAARNLVGMRVRQEK